MGSALACAGFCALSLLKFCRYYDAWSVSHSMARQRDKLLAEFYRYDFLSSNTAFKESFEDNAAGE